MYSSEDSLLPIDWNEISMNSNGGTEQMCRQLEKRIDPQLLSEFQIVPSRVRNKLLNDKIRILWCHDVAEDPENNHLRNGGWQKFHRLVFVSNWQMQDYIRTFDIPWSHCMVIANAIEPFALHEKPSGPVRLIYTPTPHRGLNILTAAYKELRKIHGDDVELEVFSSFKLYNWEERDKDYQPLYDDLMATPGVTYHGTTSNEEVREALKRSHVFAYPSTWPETSCLCLIEAMSAGLVCVHPNLGALFETAGNWTFMYQYQDSPERHAAVHRDALDMAVRKVKGGEIHELEAQRTYANLIFSWDMRKMEWEGFLSSLLSEIGDERAAHAGPDFHYEVA